jgi:hypothetical protein
MKNTRPQISESVEKTVMELKQKFNALNIAGILSGPLSDAITQNVTGKIQDNIGNFIGKSPKSKMVSDQSRKVGNVDTNFYVTALGKQPVKKGDGVATVAGKLFNLYKKSFDEKKLQMELSRNFEQEIRREDERRHKDLINSIEKTSKTSRRNAPNKKVSVSKEDIKKVQENRGGIVSKVIGAVKDAGTTAVVVGSAIVGGEILSSKTNTFKENKNDEFKKRSEVQKRVFNSFARAGFSKNQALALTAEVGRENGFRPEIMFGTHPEQAEQAKGRENVGIFSFAEERNKNLRKFMAARGLTEMRDGKEVFQRSQASLDAQAEFIRSEMQSKGFESVKREFLDKPDISRDDAAVVLGDKYIKWRRTDPVYAKHNEYRNTYYAEVQSMVNKGENMEEPQYIKVSNETSNVQSARNLSIAGDSIAYGVSGTSLGKEAKTQATQGLTTRKIIDAVKTKTTNKLGTNSKNEGDITNSDISVISAGTNDWDNLTNLSNDLEELRKVVNAKKYIWILPPNTTPGGKNIAGARKIVEAFAAKHNDETVSFDPPTGGDQIHPNPVDLEQKVRQKIKQIQSQTVIQKTETPNSGERLNNKTAENEKLKENIKPVSVINNSKKTTETGNKPEIRILSSGDKPDYPIFMVS